MSVYINGIGLISAQKTYDRSVFNSGFETFAGNRWLCQEPEYTTFIDPKQIRRMSRIIRMGIVASLLASREAGIEKPDAIIVGTAFGCLEDTCSFLSKMVQYKEDMLSPTAFIHSTHNTIAAQIALLFQSQGYNSTYVHRNLSFESALTDALLLLNEGATGNVLVGGTDEITDASFKIMERMGFFKNSTSVSGKNFYDHTENGSAGGEGSAFFSLSGVKSESSYCELAAVEMMSFTTHDEVVVKAKELLSQNNIEQPGLLITGHNGDVKNDAVNDNFMTGLNCTGRALPYKHLCGEYSTSTGFATWYGAEILNGKSIPGERGIHPTPGNILIYNQQDGLHHSLILLRSC